MDTRKYNEKEKRVDIVFIVLPPSFISIPSPAYSILKSFINQYEICSEVIYMNHILESKIDIFRENITTETESILPFLSLLDQLDPNKTRYISIYYKSLFPDLFLTDRSLIDQIKNDLEGEFMNVINDVIFKLKQSNTKIVGFTSKFFQWIPAVLIASYIKKEIPDIVIISGGWTNGKSAEDFLCLNSVFDFTTWGEGEYPLLYLLEFILYNKGNISEIPRVCYRDKEKVYRTSTGSLNSYVDFSNVNILPDYSDYFKSLSLNSINVLDHMIPIERGRGCNWNKCSFCYLSQGYKFRTKPNEKMLFEIRSLIEKYHMTDFFFTDNDVIGSDIAAFESFLDGLIILKSEYPQFKIVMAEVISKDIGSGLIKKMVDAGFSNVQIGLESISEEILTDINKKQTILDNFFFIKNAIYYGMKIKGANIIVDTPNETDDMIMDAIDNLHMYRFLLNNNDFSFRIIPLAIANFSKYLKQVKQSGKELDWNISEFSQIISDKYTKDIDRFSLLDFVNNKAEKPLWHLFNDLLSFYKRKKFSYKITYDDLSRTIHYLEYSNNIIIKDVFFDNEYQLDILMNLNDSIWDKDKLCCKVLNLSLDRVKYDNAIQELLDEDLIFFDKKSNCIVSLIKI